MTAHSGLASFPSQSPQNLYFVSVLSFVALSLSSMSLNCAEWRVDAIKGGSHECLGSSIYSPVGWWRGEAIMGGGHECLGSLIDSLVGWWGRKGTLTVRISNSKIGHLVPDLSDSMRQFLRAERDYPNCYLIHDRVMSLDSRSQSDCYPYLVFTLKKGDIIHG